MAASHERPTTKPRTVVTTDMEQDDLASLIRYLLYTNDLDTEGIVYTSSKFHWAGDGRGTEFFLPDREYTTPQTSWRWTGTRTIQDQVLPAYARVYRNLRTHDRDYPSPRELLARTKVGNIEFEGEMAKDTAGSDLIRRLLLDRDPRPLYLQAWGGTNTIARALKSIEERYAGTPGWARIRQAVEDKAVILASGFQDETYADYIAVRWPGIRVQNLSGGYATWGYNCDWGQGNTRGLPADRVYFTGAWTRANVQFGPYGSLYRSWLDGQAMPGDPLDIFGIPELAPSGWCKPLAPYDFLSEGDNVAFNPLLDTGLRAPQKPWLGGWGGRSEQVSASPDLWTLVPTEKDPTGAEVADYTTLRWAAAAQNDFAARMAWTSPPPTATATTLRWSGSMTTTGYVPGPAPPSCCRPGRPTRTGPGDDPLVAVPGGGHIPGHRDHLRPRPGPGRRHRPGGRAARPDGVGHRRGHRRRPVPADPLRPRRDPDRLTAAPGAAKAPAAMVGASCPCFCLPTSPFSVSPCPTACSECPGRR